MTTLDRRADSSIAVLDVGGTSIKSGLVDLGGEIVDARPGLHFDAEADAESVLGDLGHAARAVLDDPRARSDVLAVAFPGPFDYRAGRPLIRGQRKFDAIWGVDLSDQLRRTTARPALVVRYANDADAAAWGEAVAGAGRGHDRFLMVTLGTGFGASTVDRTVASAPGPDENEVARLYEHPVGNLGRADDVLSAHGLSRLLGVDASDVPAMAEAARSGEPDSGASFAEFGARLGGFLAPVMAEVGARALVVGGGAAGAFDLFGPSLESRLPVPVMPAALGSGAALVGASLLFATA
ncbi:MAG: ROK family protein [Actinomycetota bacterium]